MEATTGNVVWSDVMAVVRERCSPSQYQAWFSRLSPGAYGDDSLEVIVPNRFQLEGLLRNNHHALIQDVARQVTGRALAVTLSVDESRGEEDSIEFAHPIPAEPSAAPLVPRDPSGPSPGRRNPDPSKDVLASSESDLNPNYSFQNFIVGPSNRVPHAAALAVVSSPGTAYNPLFLHGSVGLGKTHLLQAICHAMVQRRKIERPFGG